MNDRLHSLDALRAVMMLLGVVLHVACAYATVPGDIWWYRDKQIHRGFDALLLVIHLFRMPLFMVLAGFFAALLIAKRGASEFARNRALRIGLPLILGIVLLFPLLSSMIGNRQWRWHTMHLWFLYDLLMLYVLALALRKVLPPVEALFDRILSSRWKWLVWPGLTALTLLTMNSGMLDTSTSFTPSIRILAAYGVFFAFGWGLYCRREHLPELQHGAWKKLCLTLPLIVLNYKCVEAQFLYPELGRYPMIGAALSGALIVWLFIFALIGLFLRYFGQPSKTMRYLSDSAYWIYLVHPPVVLSFQLMVGTFHWAPVLKFAIVTVCSTLVLLVSYQLMVRNTLVGVLLNGRRRAPAVALSASA